MLSWIFKKKDNKPVPAASARLAAKTPVARPAPGPSPEAVRQAAQAESVAWEARVKEAHGDDAALLTLARQAPSVDAKLAAVMALAGEDALKQAEREFRTHDRRVHRAAKQRHVALVAQREARQRASQLLESAAGLIGQAVIPANRLVSLDRDWQALDSALLDDAQKDAFAKLSAELTALTSERGEREARLAHWTADVQRTLGPLKALCAAVAEGSAERLELSSAVSEAQALHDQAPADEAAALASSLQVCLQLAAQVEARLALLDDLQQPTAVAEAAVTEVAVDEVAAAEELPAEALPVEELLTQELLTQERAPELAAEASALPASPASRWQSLPPVSDARVAALLDARFERWQEALAEPQRARQAERREQALEKRARKAQQAAASRQHDIQALQTRVQLAEAALADGQIADAQKQLAAIDELGGGEVAVDDLRGRVHAVQAEFARLKGWQQWGGGRVRDDLVVEAEALATLTANAVADATIKLPVKPHADAIDDLRKRWKELDRLGGATSQPLWQRFDAALKLAYAPVAAHLAGLEAARQANLQARTVLIDALDALAVAGAGTEEAAAADWKEPARALEAFLVEWRKLGPVEHTVPHKARDKLLARMRDSVARIELPLQDARRVAQRAREALVVRAKAMGAEADATGRDTVNRVRELQAEWQQQARSLPLTRAVENALWAEFKAATDAVFAQREAVFSARDAVWKENQAARVALIAQLEELHADSPAADIKRTLTEVDAQWRNAGEVPRGEVAALDARYRAVRDNAQRHLADSAQRKWHSSCDALAAKLALCEALEQDGSSDGLVDLDARWAAQPALLPLWDRALAQRWQRVMALRTSGTAVGSTDPAALDALLLNLEVALDMASPPEFQPARRDLKLRAMKAALEGRQASASADTGVDALLAQALAHSLLGDGPRGRLQAVLTALRVGGPLPRR